MADGKYSLDNILNEYHKTGGKGAAGGESALDDILNSYPATKNYEDSGLEEIFQSRKSTTDIDLSGINISLSSDYPSPEEIKAREEIKAQAEKAVRAKKREEALRENDRIKKKKQVDYEILSGDYDRKFMPDELKTSDELMAEGKPVHTGFTTELKKPVEPAAAAADTPATAPAASENAAVRDEAAGKADQPMPQKAPADDPKLKKKVKVKRKHGFDADDNFLGAGIHSRYEEEDDFDRKYGNSPLFSEEARDEIFESIANDERLNNNKGASLSEKMERPQVYERKYKQRSEAEKKPVRKAEEGLAGLIYAEEDDVEAILSQYEAPGHAKRENVRSETSPLKGFTTGIFNKLMAKGDEEEEDSELLGDIRKIRRAAPIERKHISDIDLDLSDKILQDTAQINAAKVEAEKDKISALMERREKKIKDFKLVGDEEENTEEEEEETREESVEDFESYSDVESITKDIDTQKGRLLIRLLLLAVCFVLSAYIAMANDFDMPVLQEISFISRQGENVTKFILINNLLGVAAGIIAYQTVVNGIGKIFSFKSDIDSLAALTLMACLVTSIAAIFAPYMMIQSGYVYIYTPVAIGALIFNTIGKLLMVTTAQRNFAYISSDGEHYALFTVEDENTAQNFTRGALTDFPVLAGMKKTEIVRNFLKNSYASDGADRFCRIVTPIILVASVLIGLLAGVMGVSVHGSTGAAMYVGLSTATGCIAACSCFSMTLVSHLPLNKASKLYSRNQGVIIGYDSVEQFSEVNSVLVDAAQLFPPGSISLINIKSFPDSSIDEAIVEAASLTSQSGSILKSMFYDIIVGKTEMLNPVESYMYEDSMGLCGWINNRRVLLGNRELMQNHSIEGLPSPAKESEYTAGGRIAVYLSISGQLSAMFIIALAPSYKIGDALRELEKEHVAVMLRSVDSMLSVNRLSEMFEVSPNMFKLIPFRLHPDFEKVTEYEPKKASTLSCSGRFSSFAQLILGAGRLRSIISAGVTIQAAAILVGILLTLTLVLLNSMVALTVTRVLFYNLAFVVLYYVFQAFRKL
ncbi:MAG: hypothetical protein K2N72_08225 [Oscillospiraceae bacterium]|nr:hypothetical protein [Oscillospiraceae bacterium]